MSLGRNPTGKDRVSKSVRDDHIEHIQNSPFGSPVITKEDERSSTISAARNGLKMRVFLFVVPRLAML
jgi:hypothetical protein